MLINKMQHSDEDIKFKLITRKKSRDDGQKQIKFQTINLKAFV